MKYRNMKKRYWTINLQLFAGDDDGGVGSGDEGLNDDDPEGDPEDDPEDDPDERKFTQHDVDEAIKKRLARERRKWNKEQQKKAAKKDTDGTGEVGKDGENEDVKARKEAEIKNSKLEVKVACYEADVSKDAVDDVAALAHAYMEADEDLDLEDAIEKVVKKYPHFKNHSGKSGDDADGIKGKSWGERQRGGSKKLTGVEAAFLKKNPGLKY